MHTLEIPGFDDVAMDALRSRTSSKWRCRADGVLPMGVAEMDFRLAPAIRRRLELALLHDDLGYHDPLDERLAEAFEFWARRALGWDCDREGVLPVTDAMIGVAELLRRLTSPGDTVVLTPPVYPPFFSTLQEIGRCAAEVPLLSTAGGWKLDVEGIDVALARGARAVLLCNPHNPTGAVLPAADLLAVAGSAARHGAWVVVDEIHAPLVLDGQRHQPFIALGGHAAARGATVTSASKAWNLAGLKCAVIVTSAGPVRDAIAQLPADARYRVGHLGALASETAWLHGEPWRRTLLDVLARNRTLLGQLLREHLPAVSCVPPAGTYLGWLDCRRLELGEDPAEYFMREAGVGLAPGTEFGTGGAGFARLNFATSAAILREALVRMGRVVDPAVRA